MMILIAITCLAILYFIFPKAVIVLGTLLGTVVLGWLVYATPLDAATLLMICVPVVLVCVLSYVLVRKGYIKSGL
jgi:hypothetical protein